MIRFRWRMRKASLSIRFFNIKMEKKSIGKQLSEAREAKGWTQLKLYEESRITPYTISQLENDKGGATIDTIVKLQTALGIKFEI